VTLYQTFDAPAAKDCIRRIFGLGAKITQRGELIGAIAVNDDTGRAVTAMAVRGGHVLLRFGPRTMIEGHPSVAIGREIMTLRIEPSREPGFPISHVAQLVTDYLLATEYPG
jgi:hypothetical protein